MEPAFGADAMPEMRPRVGLALSGGGFRASLFHLGVLRRLAELDVLSEVSVLSTVSGGSIVAALYYLRLKGALETSGRPDYVAIVEQVDRDLRAGMERNLRTLLFIDPLANLAIWCLGRSLGRRMAKLYTRYLYRRAVRDAFPGSEQWQKTGVPLRNARVELARAENQDAEGMRPARTGVAADLEGFNASARYRVPKFILNATCLNTGGEFQFSISEIVDPVLGALRFEEVPRVKWYRLMLVRLELLYRIHHQGIRPGGKEDLFDFSATLRKIGDAFTPPTDEAQPAVSAELTKVHLVWWHVATHTDYLAWKGVTDESDRLRENFAAGVQRLSPVAAFLLRDRAEVLRIYAAPARHLRNAKLAAWYLLTWTPDLPERRGGYTWEQHRERFWRAVHDIDVVLEKDLRAFAGGARNAEKSPHEPYAWALFYDLYFFRTGSEFDPDESRLASITLSDAVAASANFPPVFPPFELDGLFDPARIKHLALTDGGVYDNQGIIALLDEECTHIIASDAGGIPELETDPARGRLGMMVRIVEVLLVNLRNWQLRHLRETQRITEGLSGLTPTKARQPAPIEALRERYNLQKVAFFHMTSDPQDALPPGTLEPHPCAEQVARLRTDLDLFSAAEQDALIYQGYQLSDRFVREYMPDLIGRTPRPPDVHRVLGMRYRPDIGRLRRLLAAGASRFGRLLVFYPWLCWILGAAALAAVAFVLWRYSVSDLSRAFFECAWQLLRFPLFQEGSAANWIIDDRGGVIDFLLLLSPILIAAAAFYVLYSKKILRILVTPRRTKPGHLDWERTGSRARVQMGRLVLRNIWWGIALLPLLAAAAISLIALVMLVFGVLWRRIGAGGR